MHVEISIFFFFAKVQIRLKLIIKNRLHKLNYSDRSLFLLVRMYCGKKKNGKFRNHCCQMYNIFILSTAIECAANL